MSCSAQFPNDVSLSCVLSLVADVRNGVNVQTVKQALWVAGCLLAKLSPPTLPQDEVGTLNVKDIDDLCADLESAVASLEVSIASGGPTVGTQGWEVLIPIILELIKAIMENRKKKQQPAPAPNLSTMGAELVSDTGSVKAPTTKPATAESYVESPKND
jgi:hypothetical protein